MRCVVVARCVGMCVWVVCQCVSVYMRMGDSESEGGVEQDTVQCTLAVHVHQAYSGTDRPVYISLNDTR